jgi:hypothetical protein
MKSSAATSGNPNPNLYDAACCRLRIRAATGQLPDDDDPRKQILAGSPGPGKGDSEGGAQGFLVYLVDGLGAPSPRGPGLP